MDSSEPQASGEVPAVVGQRPATGGQGNDSECKYSSQFPRPPACALEERRPRYFSLPFNSWGGTFPSQIGIEARRNRRAPGTSSGELHGNDGRLRPEMPCCPPVGGDRQIADLFRRQSRHCCIRRTICVYLRDLRFLPLRWRAVFVPSCLRVFVFGMSSVFLSMPLRLCVGFAVY